MHPVERLHGMIPSQEIVPFGERVSAKQNIHRSHEQNESQIQVRNLACNAKQQLRMLSAREIR